MEPEIPPQAPLPPPQPTVLPSSNPNWRLYLEALAFTVFIFPFGNVVGPLVLWLIKKDTIPAVNEEGKRVLNFNLSWTIWSIVSCGIGFLVWLVLQIIATLKAANNEPFKHPLTIQFLK